MKFKKIPAAALAVVTAAGLAACGGSSSGADDAVGIRVWGAEDDQTLLSELIAGFEAQYPDVDFDIQLGVESESTAKDTILTDVEAAADVFAFASDQIYDLVNAGALAEDSHLMLLAGMGSVLQLLGGIAVPLFAFLLVEGFLHTSDYRWYLLSVVLFALVSEIPYDLAVYQRVWAPMGQNALCSMAVSLLMPVLPPDDQIYGNSGRNTVKAFDCGRRGGLGVAPACGVRFEYRTSDSSLLSVLPAASAGVGPAVHFRHFLLMVTVLCFLLLSLPCQADTGAGNGCHE